MASAVHIGPIALARDDGSIVARGSWCAQLSAGRTGEELGPGERSSFELPACTSAAPAAGAEPWSAIDVHVYCSADLEGAGRVMLGAARVTLAELGLLAAGEAAAEWRTSWVALRRQRRCVGAIQLGALALPTGAPPVAAATVRVYHSYEAMVSARQQAGWEKERDAARAELVELVRGGGIPGARRAQAWLSVSGARHKKQAAEANAYAQWAEKLHAEAWRSDHALSTQIHTIKKDMPRTFPDDNIFANTAHGKRTLEVVLGAACLHNRQSNPCGGYCQGLNSVAACLLTFLSDVDTFWMLGMCPIINRKSSSSNQLLLGFQRRF